LLSAHSLIFDALMVPAVVVGAVTGRWLVYRIPERLFEISVVVLTAVATAMLFR
jgi:uncharacterized membrane protein YfcA